MPDTIRLTPGRTNVSRVEFLVTLRAMRAAKWSHRRALPVLVLPEPPPEPEPAEAEERRLTADEAAEAVRLRRESASH